MANDIIIIGAGGLGREILWTIERINEITPVWNVLGFADDATEKFTDSFASKKFLGSVDVAFASFPEASFVLAVGNNSVREKIYSKYLDRNYPSIIDPAAAVAPSAEIGKGAFVAPFAVVAVDTKVGKFAIVNQHARMGHDSELGDFAQLAPGVGVCGNVKIGDGAFLGVNSSVLPGVQIGRGVKVSAGIPVHRNLKDNETLLPFGIFAK